MDFTPITIKNFFIAAILSFLLGLAIASLSNDSFILYDLFLLYTKDIVVVLFSIIITRAIKRPVTIMILSFVVIVHNSVNFIPAETGVDFFFGFIAAWMHIYIINMDFPDNDEKER